MCLPFMKNRILKEFYATLIVTVNHRGPQLLTKYPNQQLAKPYGCWIFIFFIVKVEVVRPGKDEVEVDRQQVEGRGESTG
jgi:hypothetical protein